MKKVISLIIGIVSILGIIALTTYTLTHKGIRNRNNVTANDTKIELVSSTYNGNVLAEIYSIVLNGQKHKIKFEYNMVLNPETQITSAFLRVYYDGGNIITEDIIDNFKVDNIEDLLSNTQVKNYVKITTDKIEIKKINDKEYVLLKVGYYDSYIREKYFFFDDNGDLLINKGTVIKDNGVKYVTLDNQELDVFYGVNNEEQILGKFEDNIMYALEVISHEEDLNYDIVECIYYFEDEKLVREELKTYPDIKRIDLDKEIIDLTENED